MKRAFATVSLIGLSLILLGGCGSGDNGSTNSSVPDLPQGRDVRAMVLTSEDIGRFPEGSPTRALYDWWRAIQFRDIEGAKSLYASGVKVGDLLRDIGSLYPPVSASRPSVVDSNVTNTTAKLYVIIQTLPLDSSGQVRSGTRAIEVPVVFRLVKQDGSWKLADNGYIDQRVRAQDEAAAAQARAQTGG